MENIPDRFLGSKPPVRAELLMQSGEEEYPVRLMTSRSSVRIRPLQSPPKGRFRSTEDELHNTSSALPFPVSDIERGFLSLKHLLRYRFH